MSYMHLLSSVCGLALISAIVAVWTFWRADRIHQRLQQQMQTLEQAFQINADGAAELNARVVALEQKLNQLQQQHLGAPEPESAIYAQAMQMFDHGADVSSVVASCGISSSEASLMALIREKAQSRKQLLGA